MKDEIIKLARAAGVCLTENDGRLEYFECFYELAVKAEGERICKAIKEEDDYCVTEGDYMLDSNDCIAVAMGQWVRPVYDLEGIHARTTP